MQDLNDFLELEIYPVVYNRLDVLLPEFDLQFRQKYWQSAKNNLLKTDGTEGSSGASVYIYENRPGILKSYKASAPSRNLASYICERDAKEWIEAVKFLAEFAGVTLPPNSYNETPEIREQAKTRAKARDIWQELESFFHYLLQHDAAAKDHLKYLKEERGFSDDDIDFTGFGYYPGKERCDAYLQRKGFDKPVINSVLSSFNADDRYNLAIPTGDQLGRTSGFILRNIEPNNKGDRYRYTTGFEKSKQLFNHTNTNQKFAEPLILVEGQIDSKLIEAREIGRAASINGSDLSKYQADSIIQAKEKDLIIAFDGDSAGKIATYKAIEKLLSYPESEHLNILVAELPEGLKDPNDYIKAQGTASFKKIIENANPLHIWLNLYIIDEIAGKNAQFLSTIQQEKYIEQVAHYAALIKNQLIRGRFIDVFMKSHGEHSDISRLTIEEAAAKLRYNQQVEDETKALQQVTLEAGRKLRDGKLTEAKTHLEKYLSHYTSAEIREKVKPYSFNEFLEETAKEPDDLRTGIDSLDQIIRIPQSAITLIAARPSHGKTSLMLNMFYNMIKLYPKKEFFFFTYEEPAKYLMLKILNRILFEEFRFEAGLNYLRKYQAGKKEYNQDVENAKRKLGDLINTKRLNIFSFNLNDIELAEAVKAQYVKDRTGAVYIDYIQKIPVNQSVKGYEVIKQISNTILNKIAVPLQIPVILGAQFNREARASRIGDLHADMLREGGDLEQDANTVLGLLNYNFVEDKEDEFGVPFKKGEVAQLDIKSLKYRNGTPGKIAHLELHGKYQLVNSLEKVSALNYLRSD
ncbi:DnaB-like helicase C-terminal domain-containing protein [Chondrinema litorale]|uniref:DnaB-like helicase C-terminal domain-containing protein n=1 Tax=Chondrinema litorale TaxID=2994555 RepID=UPI002543F08E|nr:DnaB-like helicase C-terminal domain-containing protein [Chondrinema litorale]UZR98632.1 toprim domain-containing protein [Chondrinema litorale]